MIAVEDAVTYPRVKLSSSDRDVGAKGWNMLLVFGSFRIVDVASSALGVFFGGETYTSCDNKGNAEL